MYRTPEIPTDSGWSPELIESLLKSLQAMRSDGLSEKAQALFFRSALRSDAICRRMAGYKSASPTEREAILGELTKFVEEHFPPKEEASVDNPDEPKKEFKGWRAPPPKNNDEKPTESQWAPSPSSFSFANIMAFLIMISVPITIWVGVQASDAADKRAAVRQEEIRAETEAVVQACLHQDYSGPCKASCMPFTYRNDLPCSCYGHLMVKDVPVRCVQK